MRIMKSLADRAGIVITATLAMTAVLAIPFLTMQPDSTASQEPAGEVFAARDRIEERFASSVFATFVVIEDREGDLLRAAPLREIRDNAAEMRADASVGPTLFGYFDADEGVDVVGLRTIADVIDEALPGGLDAATDADVKAAAAGVLSLRGPAELGLSARTTVDAAGAPVSAAMLFPVLSDDTVLGFGGGGVRLGGDTAPEEYAREVVALLSGTETHVQVWGIAHDVNLTSNEQGETAGPFIGFTIAAVLVIVGVTFRSYWILAVTGAALATLIIWLQGITNLIGLEEDLVLSLIVPIAMISFGVDFAFHSVGRYREMRDDGYKPRGAFVAGLTTVVGALVLALASDSAAFLSNTSAGIESIVQFGIGSAVALVAAFLLLGIVTPLTVMVIEERVGHPEPTGRTRLAALFGSIGAAMLAMASVLLSVFVLPVGGLALLAVYLMVAIALPYRFAPRSEATHDDHTADGRAAHIVGGVVEAISRRRALVLPVVGVVTLVAAFYATRVPTEFDVKDFFAADTDFVVALDKLDEHGGGQAGEPADILIEADLTDPAIVARVAQFADEFGQIDSDQFQRDDDGTLSLQAGVIDIIGDVQAHPAAIGAIEALTGERMTDQNSDGIPDTAAQLQALITATREIGVPFDESRLARTPDEVRAALWADGTSTATRMSIGLPGSRLVENIEAARAELDPFVVAFTADLRDIDEDALVTVTGAPITRQESLNAISRALQVSLPIAVLLCLVIAGVFMRSLRLAVVVIIPILLVVAWLYAFMYAFGFAINIVTATIGAVSIGIGIDFAIHFTERFREEMGRYGDRLEAVRAAAAGTGLALVASASSSIVGFAILAFAPMPLFASYGFLTAVMIAMALVASLAVLPPLLTLIARDDTDRTQRPVASSVATG